MIIFSNNFITSIINKDWNKTLVISPDSFKFQLFQALIVCLSLLSSFMYSFFAVFRTDVDSTEIIHFTDKEIRTFNILESIIEAIFIIKMISCFFLEYTPNNSIYPIKKIKKIAINYFKTDFIYDFLPLIPFRFLFTFKWSQLFYLIKIMRLGVFFKVLNTANFMKIVKKQY